jgi:hypothetical protein
MMVRSRDTAHESDMEKKYRDRLLNQGEDMWYVQYGPLARTAQYSMRSARLSMLESSVLWAPPEAKKIWHGVDIFKLSLLYLSVLSTVWVKVCSGPVFGHCFCFVTEYLSVTKQISRSHCKRLDVVTLLDYTMRWIYCFSLFQFYNQFCGVIVQFFFLIFGPRCCLLLFSID